MEGVTLQESKYSSVLLHAPKARACASKGPPQRAARRCSAWIVLPLVLLALLATALQLSQEREPAPGVAFGDARDAGPQEQQWREPVGVPLTPPEPRWHPPKACATLEEMGDAAAGDTRAATGALRRRIRRHLAAHGASRVRSLPAPEFCRRGFTIGRLDTKGGLGNQLYRLLTPVALALMLNRSVVVMEQGDGSVAWQDYIQVSEEVFRLRELRQLWAQHRCREDFQRPLAYRKLNFHWHLQRSTTLCQDWLAWGAVAILSLDQGVDPVAIQWFLKSQHARVRQAAADILGLPWAPDTRPNLFGELGVVYLRPTPVVQGVMRWALRGAGTIDYVLHARHALCIEDSPAPVQCLLSTAERALGGGRQERPTVLVIADQPQVVAQLASQLASRAQVITFNFSQFLEDGAQEDSSPLSRTSLQDSSRAKDWGPQPRWVAFVEFFLATQARRGFVSTGCDRVFTTYAQLAASMAAAHAAETHDFELRAAFIQKNLLNGVIGGQGHSWHTFEGYLTCNQQTDQCAKTPPLSYAWWDAPWQSISVDQLKEMQMFNLTMSRRGILSSGSMKTYCAKGNIRIKDSNLRS